MRKESMQADTPHQDVDRAAWTAPELKRLNAGSAEGSTGPVDDDGVNTS